jgi:transposase InsO family protein
LLYLGYVVTRDGLEPNPAKVAAIKALPSPADVPELRRFLGMSGYYRRFIKGYAQIAEPLVALSRGNTPWSWTPACSAAFETLRHHLSSAPVLAYPDWSRPFLLQTDASDVALGAVLAQVNDDGVEQPVAYASRTLSASERNYSATDRECVAVVWAVGLHRPYLHGTPFTIVTDHAALTWLQRLKDPTGRLARWLLTLQEYDFAIVHKSGRQHVNADYLSRVVAPVTAPARDTPSASTPLPPPPDVAAAQRDDPTCGEYLAYLRSGTLPTDRTRIRAVLSLAGDMCLDDDNVLYYHTPGTRPRLVLPRALITDVLKEAHDVPTAGHLGANKTWLHVRQRYFWEGLYADVTAYARSCRACQEKTHARAPVPGPLQPLAPTAPWDTVAMDVFGPLPVTETGRRFVLVFTDLFTKWVVAASLITQDADAVARTLVDRVISTFGCPRALLSDRGTNFTSALLRRVTDLLGLKRVFTTAYHPQTDGQAERFMSTLQRMLSKYTAANQRDWHVHLPQLVFAYNTRVHGTTGFSPYRLLFGREPSVPSALPATNLLGDDDPSDYPARLAIALAASAKLASEAITESQSKQAARYDANHPESPLRVGDLVMLDHPQRACGLSPKLQRPYRGPYTIVAFGPSPTTVRLAPSAGGPALKNLVNLARLKHYRNRPAALQDVPRPDTPSNTPAETLPDSDTDAPLADDEFIVDHILDHRRHGRGLQYLVRWAGFDASHDSWEPARNIHPDLLAEYHERRPRTASA